MNAEILNTIIGCGDLMFSSHTIYTLTFILAMSKYWYNKYLTLYFVLVQATTAVLIVAARKHYTVDVFTALYVVPMIWFLLEAYVKDINCRDEKISQQSILKFYDIDIALDNDAEIQLVSLDATNYASQQPTNDTALMQKV